MAAAALQSQRSASLPKALGSQRDRVCVKNFILKQRNIIILTMLCNSIVQVMTHYTYVHIHTHIHA